MPTQPRPPHPLAEVFGFPTHNLSKTAKRYRKNKLCPFNNRVPSCTKDKADNPLGVCSIFDDNRLAITCPIRFREQWVIAEDAAEFFFPANTAWTSLTEVQLKDRHGKSAGNIDVVLVSYDERGHILDFGALEVQAVYISGNVRQPFEYYMKDPDTRTAMDWHDSPGYPRPDYLSSSRKRLAPQLIFKGGILNAWHKKTAVALGKSFYDTLPKLDEVDPADADIAWMVYNLKYNARHKRYVLERDKTVYTQFQTALDQITKPEAGEEAVFIKYLQTKLDEKLEEANPPDAPVIDSPL